MKTNSLGKRLIGVALVVFMLMSLITSPAFALSYSTAGEVTGVDFNLVGYDYAKPVLHNGLSGELDITLINNHEIVESSEISFDSLDDFTVTSDMYYGANKQYYKLVEFKCHPDCTAGFVSTFDKGSVSLTCLDVQCECVYFQNNHGVYTAVFELPKLDVVPLAIPFTKAVVQGGEATPDEGSFELEVLNLEEGSNNPLSNYNVAGLSFTTEGTGNFDKQFTISNDNFGRVLNLLDEGILVREKNGGVDGWTYDSTVWCVTRYHAPVVNSLNNDAAATVPGYSFNFVKGKIVDGEFQADSNVPAEKMTFTNTYTYTEAVTTVKIPFVKKVSQGGYYLPPAATFKLEIFDIGNGDATNYEGVTYKAEVATNGVGDYNGEIVITGPESQVNMFTCEGFLVREVNSGAANWTYSDAVWQVTPNWDQQGDAAFVVHPTVKEIYPDGEFYVADRETVADMVFENVYTDNWVYTPKPVVPVTPIEPVTPEEPEPVIPEEPADEPEEPEATVEPEAPVVVEKPVVETDVPKTGDEANMPLWIALLMVSAAAAAGTVAYSRKQK